MQKYLSLLSISWKNGLVYRTSILMWRVRQFLGTLMALSVWMVIFAANGQFGNYNRSEMITYIFLVALLQNIILSSALNGLASTVYSGKLSHEMLKPLNLFYFFGIQEVADKAKNVAFIILESVLLFMIYKPEVVIPSLAIILMVALLVIMGTLLNFFISLLFGSLGFWSPDTWAPRFLFFMFVEFTAGRMFPLDILPEVFQKVLFFTPFPYLSFVQTQLFLGRISLAESWLHLVILGAWLGFLGLLTKVIWQNGLKDYSAAGQ